MLREINTLSVHFFHFCVFDSFDVFQQVSIEVTHFNYIIVDVEVVELQKLTI